VVEDEGQWEEPKRKGKKAPAPQPSAKARAAPRAPPPVPQPEYVAPPQPCWGLNHKPFNRDNCFRVDPAPGSPLKVGKNYSPPRRKEYFDDDSDDGSDVYVSSHLTLVHRLEG
jgi:hypothetical protein